MTIDTATAALRRACWHCESYAGLAAGGNSARCVFRGQLHTQLPLGGCAYFSRMPGSDDHLAPPADYHLGGLTEVWRDMLLSALARDAGE